MTRPRDSDSLVAVLAPLAGQIVAIQKRMHALGMLADREVLDCPRCGLREDVLISGLLITCREPGLQQDTGLRFERLTAESFRCPSCGLTVREPLAGNEQSGGAIACV